MQKIAPARFRVAWQLYFGFLVLLTVLGLPSVRTAFGIATTVVSVVGLVGLFGHAFARRVPGSSRFWRAIGFAIVALEIIGSAIMVHGATTQPPSHPAFLVIALLISAALTLPNARALFLYVDRIPDPEPVTA